MIWHSPCACAVAKIVAIIWFCICFPHTLLLTRELPKAALTTSRYQQQVGRNKNSNNDDSRLDGDNIQASSINSISIKNICTEQKTR